LSESQSICEAQLKYNLELKRLEIEMMDRRASREAEERRARMEMEKLQLYTVHYTTLHT